MEKHNPKLDLIKKMRGVAVLAAALLFISIADVQAQGLRVSGTVVNGGGVGEPGVLIYVKGNNAAGTMTASDGQYSIEVPDKNSVLVFSSLGFRTQEIDVSGRARIDVTLEEEATALDEVVVVGYGTQKKQFVVGSVSQVSSRDMLKAPATNAQNMLVGRLAGMTAIQTSGLPGQDGASLLVRGMSTFNSSSPLILVDGVERSMAYLNPNDIESVSILKDAATAAIYGVRGANGVVLVTTKGGRQGKTTIAYDGSVSFDTNVCNPELLTADEYIYWHNKARTMDGQAPLWTDEVIQSLKDRGLYGEFDPWATVFDKYGLTHQHNISASGGTGKIRYYTSLGYMNQDGILKNTGLDRYNIRANVEANIAKGLMYKVNISAAHTERLWPGLSMFDNSGHGTWQGEFSPLRQACYAIPILATTYEGLPLGYQTGTYTYTPEAAINCGYQKEKRWMAEIRSSIEYDFSGIRPLEGLKIGFDLAYNLDYTLNHNYLEAYMLWEYNRATDDISKKVSLGVSENNFNKSHSLGYNMTLRPKITYDRDFGGKHHVSAIALFERYNSYGDTITGLKKGYATGSPVDISMGMEDASPYVYGSHSSTGSASFAARLSYAYAQKYIAEISMRADGSYIFAPQNRWGYFPSVALGWVISEENFLRDVKWLDRLKLRVSAGVLGSDDTSPYLYMQTYMSTSPNAAYVVGGTATNAYYTSNYVYDNLTWSRTNTYNVGVEAKMFGNRLSFEFDWFYKLTTRILEYASTGTYSPSLGGNNPSWQNSGSVDNRGFDMTISWGDAFASGWSYTITGIMGWSRNKVLKKLIADDHPSYRAVLGQPMGTIYGFLATGLFQTQEQVDNAPAAPTGYTELGAIMYADINGDGKISSAEDYVKIGRSSIPEMTFSLNLDVAWKGISLSALFQGATLCNYSLNGTWANGNVDSTMYTRAFYGNGNTLRYLVEDAWTPENTDAKYPRLSTATNANNANASSWWIRDGSYVRLKNLQLAYDLPSKILQKTPLSAARVYLSGTNLFTISAFKYIDPENPGLNNGYYPQQRVFSIGLNLTF